MPLGAGAGFAIIAAMDADATDLSWLNRRWDMLLWLRTAAPQRTWSVPDAERFMELISACPEKDGQSLSDLRRATLPVLVQAIEGNEPWERKPPGLRERAAPPCQAEVVAARDRRAEVEQRRQAVIDAIDDYANDPRLSE